MPTYSSSQHALRFLFLILLGLFSLPLSASASVPLINELLPVTLNSPPITDPAITLYQNGERYALNAQSKFLEDKKNQWTIEDVTRSPVREQFSFSENRVHNFGLTQSTYWFSLRLNYPHYGNNVTPKKTWYLEVGRPQLQLAELYIANPDGTFSMQSSDLRKPFAERSVKHTHSIFPITTVLGEEITVYIRIQSDNALILPLTLWTPKHFIEKVADTELLYGIFNGGMLILMLYNLFVYFSVRDISYLYFVLWLLGVSLFEFIEMGHGMTLFDDPRAIFKNAFVPPIVWSSWWVVIMFTRNFLDTWRYHRRIDHFLKFLLSFVVIYGFTSLLIERDVVNTWLSGFTIFSFLLILGISLYSWAKSNENAVYFSLGWLCMVSGGIVQGAALLQLLPSTPFNVAAAPIGFLCGAVMISFSLADRIKRLQREALSANERAIENMARYRSTFNNAIEGMYRMSIEGKLVSANPAMARLLGYDSVEALRHAGKEAINLCFQNPDAQFQQLAANGRLQTEVVFVRNDGKSLWVDHSVQLIRGKDGSPSHIEGSLTDITERKERERAEQDREIDKLEKELATASAAAKGDFLANMSHEIRTPLTAIIGYSESLNDSSLTQAEEQQAIDTVIRSSHHLLSIINDILDFSKVEASIVDVEKVPVNPFLLMKDVYSYFAMKAKAQNLAFTIEYHFPLPNLLQADPTRLKQILLNLCSNAIKFTKTGGVTVDVAWDEARQLTKFSVIDTGTGLTEAQLGKLFQVYAQAEASTARQFGGTGLGLVISKELAEKMGGTIEVTSAPGQGSCFTVYVGGGVPNKREWVTSLDDAQRASESSSTTTLQVPKLAGRILYADDNPDSQRLVALMLRGSGAELELVNNGQEAVNAIQQQAFDLVLMDIKMPVLSGIDAARTLRAQGFTTPIIAITANVIKGESATYEQVGFNAILSKPIDRPAFFQTLEQYLGVS